MLRKTHVGDPLLYLPIVAVVKPSVCLSKLRQKLGLAHLIGKEALIERKVIDACAKIDILIVFT